MTAEAVPFKCHAMAAFSDVASACMSTTMTGVSSLRSRAASMPVLKGQTRLSMKTLPERFNTAIFLPDGLLKTVDPAPGAPAG